MREEQGRSFCRAGSSAGGRQGPPQGGQRCPWPRASSARDRRAQPLYAPKPSWRTRPRLWPHVQMTSKNKNTSATLLLNMEKKMAVSKSQLFHLEKNAFHKSDRSNPISLKAAITHSLVLSLPFLHLFKYTFPAVVKNWGLCRNNQTSARVRKPRLLSQGSAQ